MPLSFFLVAPAIDLSLEIPVTDDVALALSTQWERLPDHTSREHFCRRMEKFLEEMLPNVLDWDIKPPTPNQKAFAMVISRGLDIPIPSEANLYRGPMHEFLERHAEAFRALKSTPKQEPGQ